MSVNGPGQYSGYTPPPPSFEPRPPKRTSPWLYISLGCGFLVLLCFGGCVAVGVMMQKKMSEEMKHPITASDVDRALGDTPRYPGATLDVNGTHGTRVVLPVMKMLFQSKGDGDAIAFKTSDPYLKVLSWYDEKLRAKGYTSGKAQSNLYAYQKGTNVLALQAVKSVKSEGDTTFVIYRFADATIPASSK